MKKLRRGFTLIEVSLFLAVSAALFVGITIGVQNSIRQQRFNDSVQGYAEFLRTMFAETLNVQHLGTGSTETAVYGKMITFGEQKNLDGENNSQKLIFAYDVIADADATSGNATAVSALKSMNAKVLAGGEADSYLPRWSSEIQNDEYEPFVGTLLIVRHPTSGMVYTYFTDDVAEINDPEAFDRVGEESTTINIGTFLNDEAEFKTGAMDFCVNPEPGQTNILRGDVRIVENARNSSGVLVVGGEDACNK